MSDRTDACRSQRVCYASQVGAKLDSDVITGGGSDDTGPLQATLNKATSLGSLHLIMDGAALVRGLDVHSNTTIECLNSSCGFFLADNSNRPLVRNARPSREGRLDRNITLVGGTYNNNCRGQVHHTADNIWVVAMGFFGVENLLVRDLTIRNQRTFAVHLANWFRASFENVAIDLPERMQGENQDGIHMQGPGQFLTMRNIQGCAWDDFIALNADDVSAEPDGSGGLVETNSFGPMVGFGPITDVLIDGVMLNDAAQGIRLLSRGSRIDRVVIRNVIGTYRSYGFHITPCLKRGGNFGNIILDTIDLRQAEPNYTYLPPFLFRIGGTFESLVLKNIFHHRPTDDRPIITVLDGADIKSLIVDGLYIQRLGEASLDITAVSVDGWIEHFILRNVHVAGIEGPRLLGCLIETTASDHKHGIKHLILDSISVSHLNSVVSHRAGEIGTIQVGNVLCSEMGDALVSVENGNIGRIYADAIHGGKLLSVTGRGKVPNAESA